MNLEENFIKYRNITLTIMEIVKSENYENLDESFRKRQLILDNINILNCSKEECRKFYLENSIDKLDRELEEEMKNRKEEFLVKIKESQKRRMAMSGYNNNLQAKAVFLSKEF